MTTQPELIYRIPTNEEHYTQEEADHSLIAGLLDNQEARISAYLNEFFPSLLYEIERVPENVSSNHRSRAYSAQAEQALAAVEGYVEDNWYNWWPEAALGHMTSEKKAAARPRKRQARWQATKGSVVMDKYWPLSDGDRIRLVR